ncbi:MAG: hypothetical protein ACTSVI_02165 [Promethearchaeota archaeon]
MSEKNQDDVGLNGNEHPNEGDLKKKEGENVGFPAGKPAPKGKVFIKAEALKTIILYAKRYANDSIPEYDWKEVYGFLIGRLEGEDVHVDSAVPMTAGEATEVVFDANHYSKAWELDNEIIQKGDNSFVCGWWHSHPFKQNPQSVFLSSIDVANHLGFQGPNPKAIALVIDPSKIKSRTMPFGIKIFRLSRTDFTEIDLDRYALDLTPEGNTKSNENEWVYIEVPFEVIDITPELFFESLVDVFEKTTKGAPIEIAYKENRPDVSEDLKQVKSREHLTNIKEMISKKQDISSGDGQDTPLQLQEKQELVSGINDQKITLDIPRGDPSTQGDINVEIDKEDMPKIIPSFSNEIENANKIHVLPLEDYKESGDEIKEADDYYEQAITLKTEEKYKEAIKALEKAYRIYSKTGDLRKILFIKNELMECYYWNDELEDCIIESHALSTLAKKIGDYYFEGNAKEFLGRCYIKQGEIDNALHALQEARKAYESGGYFGKIGMCFELMGRIIYRDDPVDFDRLALMFARALSYYQLSLKNQNDWEPDWLHGSLLPKHGAVLEKLTKEITVRLNNEKIKSKVLTDLKALIPWE